MPSFLSFVPVCPVGGGGDGGCLLAGLFCNLNLRHFVHWQLRLQDRIFMILELISITRGCHFRLRLVPFFMFIMFTFEIFIGCQFVLAGQLSSIVSALFFL